MAGFEVSTEVLIDDQITATTEWTVRRIAVDGPAIALHSASGAS
jgi:hypothetical protein